MEGERFAPEEKWEILLEALASPLGPADTCERHGISLAELRSWLAVARRSALGAFAGSGRSGASSHATASGESPGTRQPRRSSGRYPLRKPFARPMPAAVSGSGTRAGGAAQARPTSRGDEARSIPPVATLRVPHVGMTQEEMDAVFSRTSHELREPLRGMRALARFLLEDFGEELPEKGNTYLRSIEGLVERMRQQLLGLSEFARCTRSITELRPCALTDVLRQVRTRLRPLVAKHNGSVVIDSRLPVVLGDAEALTRAFEHLVRNGIMYCTREGPQVQVLAGEADEGEGRVTVEVSDNGVGIDPQYHEAIFELFYRLHRYETQPGAGVGLTVVRRIVDAHHGEVAVASSDENGTCFSVTLLEAVEP